MVSLMLGIGSLSYERAGRLAVTGGIVLVAFWLVAFAIIFLLPLVFPSVESGSFYSASLVEAAQVDFIDLYIPLNPFSSLARTVVPAAAVFSVAFGIALICFLPASRSLRQRLVICLMSAHYSVTQT